MRWLSGLTYTDDDGPVQLFVETRHAPVALSPQAAARASTRAAWSGPMVKMSRMRGVMYVSADHSIDVDVLSMSNRGLGTVSDVHGESL